MLIITYIPRISILMHISKSQYKGGGVINLKNKLKKNELTIGSWITLAHTAIAEIMAGAGFDWLAIDMEHSAITLKEAQQLIQVIGLCGIPALVRVEENNPVIIKRVMDAGAHGVIVPMVNSKKLAEQAVSSVKYPPYGRRGVGLARAQGYGLNFENYKKWNNVSSVVIAQIEHSDAIESLEDILSVEGIDGSIIGPYDLSASLGYPGNFCHPSMKEALKQYSFICKKLKKPMGVHVIPPEINELRKAVERGYKFIARSLDTLFLAHSCREGLKSLKPKRK